MLRPSLPVQGPLRQALCNLWCCLVFGGEVFLGLVVTLPCLPQDIITALEERLKPLVQAELSVLVDVLHWPELLFLEGSEAYQRCESGGFLSK